MNEKNLNLLKWSGTAFTIAGAVLTSLAIDPWNVAAFNIGAVLWLTASIYMKETSLIAVNSALLAIYAVGAVMRLL